MDTRHMFVVVPTTTKMNIKKLVQKYTLHGKFELTNGEISDTYYDIKSMSMDPKNLRILAKHLAPWTYTPSSDPREGYDLIAGMELGAIPLVVATSLEANLPFLMIRKTKRKIGTKKQIEGSFEPGQKVLLIEDVVTMGGSVVKSINVLRDSGLRVDLVVSVILRDDGVVDVLKEMGVRLIGLVKFGTEKSKN